jgi:hypothetical protein
MLPMGSKPGLLNYARLPLQAAALVTGAKSFRDNPIIGSPKLNRDGLHVSRIRLAHHLAQWRRRRLASALDADDVAAFQRDGFILKHSFLPDAVFAALQQSVLAYRAPARETIQGDTITRRMALDPPALARLPEARYLLRDPRWLGLIRYVASSALEPLVYVQTIFSQIRDAPPDPQTDLHADTFHATVKAWLFLTDVAEDEGPFVYVPGSHIPTPRRLAWERKISIGAAAGADVLSARGSPRIRPEMLGRLGYAQPRAFAVPANTLIVADTVGFHARGPSVRPSTRIEIWAYGRRNPFLPWLGFDPAAAPLVRGRAVPIFWWAMDAAERLSLKGNQWRPVGLTRPGDPPRV